MAAAVACATSISQLGILVTRMELLDGEAMTAVNPRSSGGHAEQPTLFLEFSGSPAAVREHAEEAGEVTREHSGGSFRWSDREIECRRLLEARHQVFEVGLALLPRTKALTSDVCVPVSALSESIAAARTALDALGLTGMETPCSEARAAIFSNLTLPQGLPHGQFEGVLSFPKNQESRFPSGIT